MLWCGSDVQSYARHRVTCAAGLLRSGDGHHALVAVLLQADVPARPLPRSSARPAAPAEPCRSHFPAYYQQHGGGVLMQYCDRHASRPHVLLRFLISGGMLIIANLIRIVRGAVPQ